MKGVAGTIGATVVANRAKELERLMQERSKHWPQELLLLEEVLKPLFFGLEDYFRQFPDKEDEDEVSQNPVLESEAVEMLECLFSLIEDNDIEAIGMMDWARKSFLAALGKKKFTALSEALATFNFEDAKEILRPFIPHFFK
jgi:hypothetical protein